MIKKISVLSLGMLLSAAALNACECNNPEGDNTGNNFPQGVGYAPSNTNPNESDTVYALDRLGKVNKNAVIDYLGSEQTKQVAKDEHRNTLLKSVAIGVGSTVAAGVVVGVAGLAYCVRNLRFYC